MKLSLLIPVVASALLLFHYILHAGEPGQETANSTILSSEVRQNSAAVA
jgi:hypothetical protein